MRAWVLGFLLITACTPHPQPGVPGPTTSSADTMPAAVVQRFVDAANARKAAAMAALVARDAAFARFPEGDVIAESRDSIQAFYGRLMARLSPSFRVTIERRIVEHHLVIDQEYFAGTPAEQGSATWIYEVYGGLIHRAWRLSGRQAAAR